MPLPRTIANGKRPSQARRYRHPCNILKQITPHPWSRCIISLESFLWATRAGFAIRARYILVRRLRQTNSMRESRFGWCGSFAQFFSASGHEVIQNLEDHHVNCMGELPSSSQRVSWEACIDGLLEPSGITAIQASGLQALSWIRASRAKRKPPSSTQGP